jgi:hypothetical protein
MDRRTAIGGLGWAVGLCIPLLVPGPARAEDAVAGQESEPGSKNAQFSVSHGPGAEACPDGATLAESVESIRGKPDLGRARYLLRFVRNARSLRVMIRSESGRSRTLDSDDMTCAALARATAVTLAVLFDGEEDHAESEAPKAPVPKESAPAAAVPAVTHRPRVDTSLAVAATALAGITGPVGLGVTGESGFMVRRFRAGIGIVWMPSKSSTFGPGEIEEALTAGFADLCYAPASTKHFRLDVCSGALIGVIDAEGHGYSRDERRVRPWLAVPVDLEGTLWTGRIGWALRIGAVFPVRRSDFGIEGIGVGYRSPPAGFLASLGVIGLGPGWP